MDDPVTLAVIAIAVIIIVILLGFLWNCFRKCNGSPSSAVSAIVRGSAEALNIISLMRPKRRGGADPPPPAGLTRDDVDRLQQEVWAIDLESPGDIKPSEDNPREATRYALMTYRLLEIITGTGTDASLNHVKEGLVEGVADRIGDVFNSAWTREMIEQWHAMWSKGPYKTPLLFAFGVTMDQSQGIDDEQLEELVSNLSVEDLENLHYGRPITAAEDPEKFIDDLQRFLVSLKLSGEEKKQDPVPYPDTERNDIQAFLIKHRLLQEITESDGDFKALKQDLLEKLQQPDHTVNMPFPMEWKEAYGERFIDLYLHGSYQAILRDILGAMTGSPKLEELIIADMRDENLFDLLSRSDDGSRNSALSQLPEEDGLSRSDDGKSSASEGRSLSGDLEDDLLGDTADERRRLEDVIDAVQAEVMAINFEDQDAVTQFLGRQGIQKNEHNVRSILIIHRLLQIITNSAGDFTALKDYMAAHADHGTTNVFDLFSNNKWDKAALGRWAGLWSKGPLRAILLAIFNATMERQDLYRYPTDDDLDLLLTSDPSFSKLEQVHSRAVDPDVIMTDTRASNTRADPVSVQASDMSFLQRMKSLFSRSNVATTSDLPTTYLNSIKRFHQEVEAFVGKANHLSRDDVDRMARVVRNHEEQMLGLLGQWNDIINGVKTNAQMADGERVKASTQLLGDIQKLQADVVTKAIEGIDGIASGMTTSGIFSSVSDDIDATGDELLKQLKDLLQKVIDFDALAIRMLEDLQKQHDELLARAEVLEAEALAAAQNYSDKVYADFSKRIDSRIQTASDTFSTYLDNPNNVIDQQINRLKQDMEDEIWARRGID